MKEKIKKYIGEVILLVGSFTTTYNLFSFENSYYGSDSSPLGGLKFHFSSLPEKEQTIVDPAVYYYYSNESLFLLGLGVTLIILGILIIKKKND